MSCDSHVTSALCHVILRRTCDEDNFLPMLSYVLKRGNVTLYEWKHGKAPPTTLPLTLVTTQTAVKNADSADIDWGDNEIGALFLAYICYNL